MTRASLRFFTDFYGSDIVIASPLALVTRLEAFSAGPQEADFLSSIELVTLAAVSRPMGGQGRG